MTISHINKFNYEEVLRVTIDYT